MNERGGYLSRFTRENAVKLQTHDYTLYPDSTFQIFDPINKRTFNFAIELDNGTERIQSTQDVESIARKLRGYERHQSQFGVFDNDRYLVIFLTTRSHSRLFSILECAKTILLNLQRTVFLGCDLRTWLSCDPFTSPVLQDHRGLKRLVIPAAD